MIQSKKRIIIGIDPGLRYTGWGIICKEGEKISYIDSSVISTTNISNMDKLEYKITNIFSFIFLFGKTP